MHQLLNVLWEGISADQADSSFERLISIPGGDLDTGKKINMEDPRFRYKLLCVKYRAPPARQFRI